MNTSASQRVSEFVSKGAFFFYLLAACVLAYSPIFAAETPPRLYFADAKMSFIFPAHWDLNPSFPFGPLFSKKTQDGEQAVISCAISQPLDANRITADIPREQLRELARRELSGRQPGFKSLQERDYELVGQKTFEIIWENTDANVLRRNQSVYFFVENRIYALNLQAPAKRFRWLSPDFETWLRSLQILSHKDKGALLQPSHGGLWIHQTAGVKISLPEDWLIAVADEQTLGATQLEAGYQADLTVTVDAGPMEHPELSDREKKDIRKMLVKKGFQISKESEAAFHGLPAFQIEYEGSRGMRYVQGIDVWVVSPKARFLFNIEADGSLFTGKRDFYNKMINDVQFL